MPLRVFSLRTGAECDELVVASPPSNFVDLDAATVDFDDTAAAISNLDIVVTCDTAVPHLASALDTPTFVVLPNTPDWRYVPARQRL